MTRKMPKEHEDAMIEAYLNGATLEQAARPFGYDKSTCSNVLKRYGITTRPRNIPREHEDAMIDAYLAGATQEQAAGLFGYNETTCSNVLKRRGITRRTLSEALCIPKEHEDGMIAAYLEGASAVKAAALFGYTDMACVNALKRHGITPRNHAEVCRIPQGHEDAIVAAYLAGATLEQAAALFGYSGNTCLNVLRRRGITPRSHAEVLRIPQEHEDAIIAAYLAGASLEEASALFGYSGNTCHNALRRRGITSRSHTEVCSIPPEHEDGMIAAYMAGASTEQAAALFGHSGQTCTNILKRRGIIPRSHEEACRHYAVDESFFDCIDTEEKAYWLGFLTADGGIVRSAIILQLQKGDADHLYKFASSIRSEHPISNIECNLNGKRYPAARIRISSTILVSALGKLGVRPNKSFDVHPCEYVPDLLLNSYWRGILDGDGSIYSDLKGKQWTLSLVGNQFIVTGFRDYIARFVNSKAVVKPHKNIFEIKYSGFSVPRAVAQVLYSGATIYLDRKYVLARKLCGSIM